MSRQYDPADDYQPDDQLLAEAAHAEAATEAAQDAEAMDAAWGGDWPTPEEIAEYERTLNQRRTA